MEPNNHILWETGCRADDGGWLVFCAHIVSTCTGGWEQSGACKSGLGMSEQPSLRERLRLGFLLHACPRWKRSAKCYWSSSRGSICWEVAGTSPSLSWYSLLSGGIGNREGLAFCRRVELGLEGEDCDVWIGRGRRPGRLKDKLALILSRQVSGARNALPGSPSPLRSFRCSYTPWCVLRGLSFLKHSPM